MPTVRTCVLIGETDILFHITEGQYRSTCVFSMHVEHVPLRPSNETGKVAPVITTANTNGQHRPHTGAEPSKNFLKHSPVFDARHCI